MTSMLSMDAQVRTRLRAWPQKPPGLPGHGASQTRWMRARPCAAARAQGCHPFLKLPGSQRLRTVPDGLWLYFGGSVLEPFVDIFAVEACGTFSNLLDKRARFAPSTSSMVAVCPVPWLLGQVSRDDPTPRWRRTGALLIEPVTPLIVPVRDVRVMYALKERHYSGFAASQVPHAHEYFVPMSALVAERSDQDPRMMALLGRASIRANFLILPDAAMGAEARASAM